MYFQGFTVHTYTNGSLAFTTPIAIATTIFLEIVVPARRIPMIISFVWLTSVSISRVGRSLRLRVIVFPYSQILVFHELINKLLKVNLG